MLKKEKKFIPTELGILVTDLLLGSFADIMQVQYTARMERLLDEIEEGRADYSSTIEGFYKKFSKDLSHAQANMTNVKAQEIPTEEVCDKCGKPMVIKWGRFGHFLACSGYPDCREVFFEAFAAAVDAGTRPETKIQLRTPLLHRTKAQIVARGVQLDVPFELTWSCYVGDALACGRCESCRLRRKGFDAAGVEDPLAYEA